MIEALEAFRNNRLELWCPKITVRKQKSEKLIEYSGAGLIRQNQNRRLEFVLIENPSPSVSENLKRMLDHNVKVGKLISSDDYYSLEAIDLSGLNWTANRLWISHSFGPAGSIAYGDVYILEHKGYSDSQNNTINIEIFDNINLPLPEATKKTIKLGSDELASWRRNMVNIKIGQFEITILNEPGFLTVSAAADNENFPGNFETRIIEALQFISSRTIHWGILCKTIDGKSSIILQSPQKKSRPINLSLPIDYNRSDIFGYYVWPLFEKYLQHILSFEGENIFEMHPISAWLHFARNASTGSIYAKGLGLSIAIEGILECEYSNIGIPSQGYVKDLEEMISYVDSFSGNENIKLRALGALNSMKITRAKDKLLALREEGIVRRNDVFAWDAIRNKGAHARPPEKEERQTWIDNCFKLEVLLNHLIFNAIEYNGEYTDYSSLNWPQSLYPGNKH